MAAYIYEKLRELMKKNAYPMHMPGHKRNNDLFPVDLYKWDITETGEVDNLHHPTGIIKQANEAMADALGADRSYLLVNGGSSGVAAAIAAVVGENEKIAIATNCHKSAYNGLIISGANPIYISPRITEEGLCGGIAPSDIFRTLSCGDVKAVVITSPTYEGFVSDVKVLADIVHKNNAILIVDECHGSHFPFSDWFPKTAISQGADIVINSWHKTLPCPNQAAVISVKSEKVDIKRLEDAISMMTTTSPSYPIMASMDYMREMLTNDRNLTNIYTNAIWEARHLLAHCKSLKLVGDSIKGQHSVDNIDIGKFTIMVRTNMTGVDLANILLEKYNFQVELAGLHHIIAMTSVADTPKAIMKFAKAIVDIDKKCKRVFIDKIPLVVENVSECAMTPRQIFYAHKTSVKLSEAVGRIAGESVIAYPPGVPVVAAGQVIKSEHIGLISKLKFADIEIMGTDDNKILVLEE